MTRKTTLEEICEKLDYSPYDERDMRMNICLSKGLGYIDRTVAPHRFRFLPRGDYEIVGWVELKNGQLRASGVDVKSTNDGGFVWKGKKFPEGTYFLVKFQSGREALFNEDELRRLK
mgnify:CR=1 FL=1